MTAKRVRHEKSLKNGKSQNLSMAKELEKKLNF